MNPMRQAALLILALATAAPAAAQRPDTATVPSQLSLLDAIRLGRARGVSETLAELNVRVVNARVAQRRADLLPSISGSADVSRRTINFDEFGFPGITGVTDPFNIYAFQLRGSQTLFDAAALTRLRAGHDTAAAAGLDARAIGEAAGASAGLAYLRVLSAEETVAAREADSTIASSLLEQARQLVSAGVSAAIDATRSEVGFASVRAQLEVARNARDRARLDLTRLLDVPATTPLTLTDSLVGGGIDIPTDADAAVAFARAHRPELAAEHARAEAARRTLNAIRLEALPSVGLSGYYQQTGNRLSSLAGTYLVQLGIHVPILDGFRRQARAAEQRVRVEAAELRERDLGNAVETEARQAMLDLASARHQVELAGTRVRLAEQELSQALERFKAGVAGGVETNNAQSSVITARDALIQARVAYGTARIGAYRALGVLSEMR
ncbi:MAG: TolC family protein [Bacillota bacterium]|jgi:outer membrane protein TolC